MKVLFELNMCNVGSWNGHWHGENKKFFRIRNFFGIDSKKMINELLGSYHYSWNDGYACNVYVTIPTPEQIKYENRYSDFCGYDWMIDSIIKYKKILSDKQIKEIKV